MADPAIEMTATAAKRFNFQPRPRTRFAPAGFFAVEDLTAVGLTRIAVNAL